MRGLLIFTGIVAVLLGLADYAGLPYVHAGKWVMLGFLFALSLGVIALQQWVTRHQAKDWVIYYLGIIVGRLVISICFLGYFIFSKEPGLYTFIANFFVLYLSFTGFEIYALLANLRRNSIS